MCVFSVQIQHKKCDSTYLGILDIVLEHAGEGEEAEPGEEGPVLPRAQLPLHVLGPGGEGARPRQPQRRHQLPHRTLHLDTDEWDNVLSCPVLF